MKNKLRFLAAVMALGSAGAALAHHSYAMFDVKQKVTITGTVTRFDFVNPHTWLVVAVKDEATGKDVEWRLEGNEPTNLAKHGWKRTLFKPGDTVSVVLNPLRDGTPGGSFLDVTLNGVVYSTSR